MANQIWYKKATVQSSLVSTIPAALVGLATILIMIWIASKQNGLTEKIANDQEKRDQVQDMRDSILNEKNIELANKQFALNENEIGLLKNKSLNDSLLMGKQIALWNDQNLITQKQLRTNELALNNQINFNEYQKINKKNDQLIIERDNKLRFRIACSNIESGFYNLMDSFIYKYGVDQTILEINNLHRLFEAQLENPFLSLDTSSIKVWRIGMIQLERTKKAIFDEKNNIDYLIKNPIKSTDANDQLISADMTLSSVRATLGFARSFYESVYTIKVKNIDAQIKDGFFTN